jgi:hypothetical protein
VTVSGALWGMSGVVGTGLQTTRLLELTLRQPAYGEHKPCWGGCGVLGWSPEERGARCASARPWLCGAMQPGSCAVRRALRPLLRRGRDDHDERCAIASGVSHGALRTENGPDRMGDLVRVVCCHAPVMSNSRRVPAHRREGISGFRPPVPRRRGAGPPSSCASCVVMERPHWRSVQSAGESPNRGTPRLASVSDTDDLSGEIAHWCVSPLHCVFMAIRSGCDLRRAAVTTRSRWAVEAAA